MLDSTKLPAVDPNELLARYIFSRSHFSRQTGRVKANAFMPAPDGEFSVTRHREATQDELWQVGHGIAKSRDKTLYGRGDVLAATCASQRLTVEAVPVEGNPNHANVIGWPLDDKATLKLLAEEIAAAARFVLPPESNQ